MPISIQLASDLHLEYRKNQTPVITDFLIPSAEILILAGDIGSIYKFDQLEHFIKSACSVYEMVFYLPGNNEYYLPKELKSYIPFDELNKKLVSLEDKYKNLVILNNATVQVDNYCFIGATLWSNIPSSSFLPKFIVKIPDMNVNRYNSLHNNDLNYINDMLEFAKKKDLIPIVITHHVPSYNLLSNSRRNYKYSYLYANNLDLFISKTQPLYWLYGHIHTNTMIRIGKTNLLSNQLGKPEDNVIGYSPKNIISLQ